MCGIIGISGRNEVSERLVDGLRRLEYRGYDSAGVCTLVDGKLERRRAQGKLTNLEGLLRAEPLPGIIGIAHTRWATHGTPTVDNAHPHITDQVALVHNGIIENFKQLREELIAEGRLFHSETDSEVAAHLISREVEKGVPPVEAVRRSLKRLHGAFALAILFRGHPDLLIGARRGSPLVIGFGDDETYLGSDAIALARLTEQVSYLEDGDLVVMCDGQVDIFDAEDRPAGRPVVTSNIGGGVIDKGKYRHFMLKEISEQPVVVAQTLGSYLRPLEECVRLPGRPLGLNDIKRISLVGCGTASYACMVAKYWIEQLARVPVEVDVASEFRYRQPVLEEGGLALFVSQSGETADTLAALRHARLHGQATAAVVNVPTSTMSREVDSLLPTHAGPEIGVASTKAFTCQLAVLAAFAVALARAKGRIGPEEEARLVRLLTEVPGAITMALRMEEQIAELAQSISRARNVLYLGRGMGHPLALEGALKLKEISYIHAEGYAAGELKHGPIALVDEGMPVVVIAPSGPLFEKTVSNMQEVMARSGRILLISDSAGIAAQDQGVTASIEMPAVDAFIAPLVYAVPLQLLAYHVALAKGTDVDQPRNLAKSVTVE